MFIQDLVDSFYADVGIIALTQPERLHRAFDVLTGLFDQVGLRTSTQNIVSISCQPCHTPGKMLVETNERRMTVTGTKFWERQWRRVKFSKCGVKVNTG